jgi:hypothetical protein
MLWAIKMHEQIDRLMADGSGGFKGMAQSLTKK